MKESDFAAVLTERRDAVRAELAAIFGPAQGRSSAASGAPREDTPAGQRSPDSLGAGDRFVWEVGCGHGHFLTAYATGNRSEVCIGVDIASDRIVRARKKAERARLPHLHFLRTEASLFLDALPPSVRISSLFILFPDPWPKLRHHKHRVLQPEFLAKVARCAAPACRLHFRTDFEPYFKEARAVAAESPSWSLVEAPWPFEFETVFQSRAADGYFSFIAEVRPTRTP